MQTWLKYKALQYQIVLIKFQQDIHILNGTSHLQKQNNKKKKFNTVNKHTGQHFELLFNTWTQSELYLIKHKIHLYIIA